MSRSYKKNPIVGNTCAESEKRDKRYANRKFRKMIKSKLHTSHYDTDTLEDTIFPSKQKDASDNWLFSKDGKTYVKSLSKKVSSEFMDYFKKIIRK